ncbi:DUF2316 family protein [Lacticaseibacillus sp. GG6-2]
MSLNPQQIADTIAEFDANLKLSGLTKQQVASDLHISLTKLEHLLNLTQQSLNDPWILRNYLIEKVQAAGKEPVPFTALRGDWHHYWFLDSGTIDRREFSYGDD